MVTRTPDKPRNHAARAVLGLVAAVTLVSFGLSSSFAPPASASPITRHAVVSRAALHAGDQRAHPAANPGIPSLAADSRSPKHAEPALSFRQPDIEVLVALVCPAQRNRGPPAAVILASDPADAGGDPVNASDPTGDCVKVLYVCIGSGPQTGSVTFNPSFHRFEEAAINVGDGFLEIGSSGKSCDPLQAVPYVVGQALPWVIQAIVDGAAGGGPGSTGDDDNGAPYDPGPLPFDPALESSAQEAHTMQAVQQIFGNKLTNIVYVDQPAADYTATLNGQPVSIDMAGSVRASVFWNQGGSNIIGQIAEHTQYADIVPVDLRGFTSEQIAEVQKAIAQLPPEQQAKIVPIGFSR